MRSLCIVPVYNQCNELPRVLEKCRKGIECDRLLLVDDGSDDGTTEIVRESGFDHLCLPERRGIGHALICGTRYAIERGFDVVMHMAGNGKMQPDEMGRLLAPLREGRADYVWGSRFLPGGRFDNAPLFRKYAIRYGFNWVPRLFAGTRVSDATCGFRAYRLSLLEDFAPGWDAPWLYGYEFEYYVLIKVLKSGRPYLEVPISMLYPPSKKNYSKIVPFISWWSMLKPWVLVGLGLDSKHPDRR